MEEKLVTFDVSHDPMFWLNIVAPLNIDDKLLTLDVFHALMSWLNTVAPWNMLVRLHVVAKLAVWTRLVSGWLNLIAIWNMLANEVHRGADHVARDTPPLLNADALKNILFINATLDTFHALMS